MCGIPFDPCDHLSCFFWSTDRQKVRQTGVSPIAVNRIFKSRHRVSLSTKTGHCFHLLLWPNVPLVTLKWENQSFGLWSEKTIFFILLWNHTGLIINFPVCWCFDNHFVMTSTAVQQGTRDVTKSKSHQLWIWMLISDFSA